MKTRRVIGLFSVLVALTSLFNMPVQAGSGTWKQSPGSNDWNTGSNWTSGSVPTDTATFDLSNTTDVSISAFTQIGGIVFNAGASAFTITASPMFQLEINGTGVTNNSGTAQNFVVATDASANVGEIIFRNSATAGSFTKLTNNSAAAVDAFPAMTEFFDSSSAAGATINNNGAAAAFAAGGETGFGTSSTAGNATINNNAGTVADASGGDTRFAGISSSAGSATINNNAASVSGATGGQTRFLFSSTAGSATLNNNGASVSVGVVNPGITASGGTIFGDSSSAGNATIRNNGALASGGDVGSTYFGDSSSAGSATLVANAGTGGGGGGTIVFANSSTGGTARVEVFGNGSLDISQHNAPSVTVGSIQGNGNVFLGANNLTVGMNNLNATFSGAIQDGGKNGGTGGSLTKIGSGTLALNGNSTYNGNTNINGGVLKVNGSITSAVTVNSGGTLGGSGTTGSVTVNSGGFVVPGDPNTLHVSGNYVQNGGATLRLAIAGTGPGSFDQLVITGGISLLSGAVLELDFVNGFAPKMGDKFDLLSSGTSSITGNFSTVNIEGLAPGFQYTLGLGSDGNFDLTALNNGISVPEPSSALIFLAGSAIIVACATRRKRTDGFFRP